jgi:hypothetical protein
LHTHLEGWRPTVALAGHTLSSAQAMTVRVAIGSFAINLLEGLGDDTHGKLMTEAYKLRLREIIPRLAASK